MSCEKILEECYRHAGYSLRKRKEFSDLINEAHVFDEAVQKVVAAFVIKNHSEGVKYWKAFIGRTAYNTLLELLRAKIKDRERKVQLPENPWGGPDGGHFGSEWDSISLLIEKGSISSEDKAIIKDCIDRLDLNDRIKLLNKYNIGYLNLETSFVPIVRQIGPAKSLKQIYRALHDCITAGDHGI